MKNVLGETRILYSFASREKMVHPTRFIHIFLSHLAGDYLIFLQRKRVGNASTELLTQRPDGIIFENQLKLYTFFYEQLGRLAPKLKIA